MPSIIHRGFDCFRQGRFEDGGSNLYVSKRGTLQTIHRTDLNNDGNIDIVIPNGHGYIERGPTWIYKPNRDSDPATWNRRQLPNDSGWMSRVVDVDGDGYLDLVVVNGENGVTSELPSYVYWGGPQGLTGERTELPTAGAYDVAIADINGDGKLELIFPSAWVDHHNPGKPRPVHVYAQRGDRTFENIASQFPFYSVAGSSVAAGDLTGNGHPDLLFANYRDAYDLQTDSFLFLADAQGQYPSEPLRLPTVGAAQVFLADLHHTGLNDVIFSGGDQVRIYWNRQGKIDPADHTIIHAKGIRTMFRVGAVRAAAADVDNDGSMELLIAMENGVEIRSATDLHTVRQFLPLDYADWVEVADLDGDGRPEILASRYRSEASYDVDSAIFWNSSAGFSSDRMTAVPMHGAVGIAVGDLDNDGKPVVIFNSTLQGPGQFWKEFPVYVYLGNDHAQYDPARRLELPSGGEANSYLVADLNDNGHPDLVIAEAHSLRIFTNQGDGLKPDRHLTLPCSNIGVTQQVHVADFNGDGYLDLLASSQTYDDRPETYANSSRIFWNSPQGFHRDNFTNFPTYGEVACMADLDNDGLLDILVSGKDGSLHIYHGSNNFSFDDRTIIPLNQPWLGGCNVADLTGNGYLDLIIGIASHYERLADNSSVLILFGGPEGYSLDRSCRYCGMFTPGNITVTDINNDGTLDLLVPAYSTDKTRVLPTYIFPGRRDPQRPIDFDHPLTIRANSGYQFLALDLNNNGYNDLIFACHRDDVGHQVNSKIYWNGPQGICEERVTLLPGMGPHYLRMRDPGNSHDRKPCERYTSPPIELGGRRPTDLHGTAHLPRRTELRFQLRFADHLGDLESARWTGPKGPDSFYDAPGCAIAAPPKLFNYMQYRAEFVCYADVDSPRLEEVRIDVRP
jgi:hypothetical protein